MTVSAITVDDIPDIIYMVRLMHHESRFRDRRFDREKIEQLAKMCHDSPSMLCLIARAKDGKPTGFFAAIASEQMFNSDIIINDLAFYVLPEYRGQLHALRMLRMMTDWKLELNAWEMRIGVSAGINNDKVDGMLRKLNLKQVDQVYIF